MRLTYIRPLFAHVLVAFSAAVLHGQTITNLSDFTDCIGPNSKHWLPDNQCTLAASPATPYSVSVPLSVTRTGLTIYGTIVSSLSDTTLQRSPSLGQQRIMAINAPSVALVNLTFDGNRPGVSGLTCLSPGSANSLRDLEMTPGADATVYNVQFINAPGSSIYAGSGSHIYQSIFKWARVAGVLGIAGVNIQVTYSTFETNGVNALFYTGQGGYVDSNQFWNNHDEFIYASGGGQMLVGDYGVSVSENFIDGNHVHGTPGAPAGPYGCIVPTPPPGVSLDTIGIEAYRPINLNLWNNAVWNHNSAGIELSAVSGSTNISTYDPFHPGYAPQNVGVSSNGSGNGFNGYWFTDATAGTVTFDSVFASGNSQYGIRFENTSSPGGATAQFQNNACLASNDGRFFAGTGINVQGVPSTDTCPPH